jgi:hypothetical protein
VKRKVTFTQLAVPAVNRTVMLAITSIVIVACITDTSIIKLSAFTGCLSPSLNIAIFSGLTMIYAVSQYLILVFIKRNIKLTRLPSVSMIRRLVSIIQYILIAIFVLIIFQMVFTSAYDLFLLKVVVWISYGVSVALLGLLAEKFLSWFRSSHALVVILYATAMGILSVNAFFTILTVTAQLPLTAQQEKIRPLGSPVSIVVNADNIFNSIYVVTSILSFIFIWVATVLLLRYYSKRLGTAKYWILVSAPLFYFLSQFQVIFFDLFAPFRLSDPILFGIVSTLVFSMAKPIGGVLFGIAFWTVARRVSQHTIKDYLMVSAYGIILLFTSNQATDLIIAPYPPFGLVTVSFMGLSSYMLLVGIYSSAISISQDSELRKSIRTLTVRESKLLDSIGTAEMELEIQRRVLTVTKQNQNRMAEETGIQPSLTDEDVKAYLEQVIKEVKKPQGPNNGNNV